MKDLEYYKDHLDDLVIRTTCAEEQKTVIVIPRKGATRLSTSDNMMLTKMRRVLKDPDTAWRLVDVSVAANETDPPGRHRTRVRDRRKTRGDQARQTDP